MGVQMSCLEVFTLMPWLLILDIRTLVTTKVDELPILAVWTYTDFNHLHSHVGMYEDDTDMYLMPDFFSMHVEIWDYVHVLVLLMAAFLFPLQDENAHNTI